MALQHFTLKTYLSQHNSVNYVLIRALLSSSVLTNININFFNTFCLYSQFQLVESIHCPIVLKSSLCNGILESMCTMDCPPSVKAVLLFFSTFAFVQVIPIVLFYCLPNWIAECWSCRPLSIVGSRIQTVFEVAEYCASPEWCAFPICKEIHSRLTRTYIS